MICALCKYEKGKLIDSHFMPAAAYPHIRGRSEQGNKSPVRINFWQKSAFHTDGQVKRKLLCKECEDLFSKNGERKLGELWATKSGFPLLTALQSHDLESDTNDFTLYDSNKIDKNIIQSIFYFTISIIWRAQVWDWGWEADGYKKALGSKYERRFRDFLLGHTKALDEVLLFVELNTDIKTSAVMNFPTCSRVSSDRLHTFDLLGMKFRLFVGQRLSATTREPFETLNTNTIFISSNFRESVEFAELSKHVQSTIIPRGNLAKRH
ncbi:hypothetical protein [Pseudomonas simiae]|uniref:hypothetical protein n=1 Tax=Pseudomonas simiae TaxID=321846 RepID=UPI002732BAAC|nr:hypothetical protein [Pseudomonas simiae]WLI03101.1 hypothetical protein PSH95_10305 [Pseudomonas simiae]